MRLHTLILMTTVLFSGSSFAQGWLEYIDQSSFFSVNFPAEPVVQEISHESTQGLIFPKGSRKTPSSQSKATKNIPTFIGKRSDCKRTKHSSPILINKFRDPWHEFNS